MRLFFHDFTPVSKVGFTGLTRFSARQRNAQSSKPYKVMEFIMRLRTIQQCGNLKGKKVFLRVDFNTPLEGSGQIMDFSRIERIKTTMVYLLKKGVKIIIASHLGRPHARVARRCRLEHVREALEKFLQIQVQYVAECVGPKAERAVEVLKDKEVLLLENLRFHPGEESNDTRFAKQLAALADIYVNDAFSNSHRKHASMVAITRFLPGYAGCLLQEEVKTLGRVLEHPRRPYGVLVGGAKIADKLESIKGLLRRVDFLLLGGGVANTFLRARGQKVGRSLIDKEAVDVIRQWPKRLFTKIVFPLDVVGAKHMKSKEKIGPHLISAVSQDEQILDIGAETIQSYARWIQGAQTFVWAGAVGVFEMPEFQQGTQQLLNILADSKVYSVLGGGDTLRAVDTLSAKRHFSYLSTGGGAMLQFLSGKKLPALLPLEVAH